VVDVPGEVMLLRLQQHARSCRVVLCCVFMHFFDVGGGSAYELLSVEAGAASQVRVYPVVWGVWRGVWVPSAEQQQHAVQESPCCVCWTQPVGRTSVQFIHRYGRMRAVDSHLATPGQGRVARQACHVNATPAVAFSGVGWLVAT
jgi:hypothetical protein